MKGAVLLVLFAAACAVPERRAGAGDDAIDGIPDEGCQVAELACADGLDDDCDGKADCSDSDCSGVGSCAVCGAVENPEAQPLALPDGLSSGAACSTDAQCGGGTPNCVSKECHASYTSTLTFVGFPQGAVLADPTLLRKVCVTIEHSWLRDLQMELITPNGSVFILDKWYDRDTLDEVYLGQANDGDNGATPVPGTGMEYCWTPDAPVEMINSNTGVAGPTMPGNAGDILVPGDYKSSLAWSHLAGVPLNGTWTMRVTDLWGQDNGFMFAWSIAFDPSLVADCAGPIIL